MGGGIYLIDDDDRLVEMTEKAYDSEDQLQELLEKYPNILAGDQIDRATPRRWLSINRESAIAPEEDGVDRWNLDHLFIDQDGIPTLVEVKRSRDAEMRQKMLGQMIDYAANALIYWPFESIVTQFEVNCREVGRDPEQVFEEFLGEDANEEGFWSQVKTNLQAGKFRLVFVADEIPGELRRVVEFLNEQMDPTEVLGLEIKQYLSEDGQRTLVPRLIGQTAGAQQKKSSTTRERRQWDESSFFKEFKARQGREEAELAKKLYDWIRQKPEVEIHWGRGGAYGGFAAKFAPKGRKSTPLFTVGISGEFLISSSSYAAQTPFDEPETWLELRSRMSAIGLALPMNATETRLPNFRLSTLQDETALQRIYETFEWVIQEIKSA
ncbi:MULTISPECIES: hypothetical protein [Planktothricoides]|uniref:DUF91 domain-containing protein n=2 Tax=Planktothricoides raciborskii TaxID=132608 RepID=A0AAU8JJS9_9CYAN|nr:MULTISPECIES: hypothetical protein [Planktothricoides]KOR34259.1 hypothetical protein AM228_25185 [Planktothricoides sp. SR001]MBD2547674.1 hypothetical protein [Planktothricoides raciborskii FACHB-1370]MBD2586110.1 hypothetical protein [Planktothricoides raciborskii FACHB-1261]